MSTKLSAAQGGTFSHQSIFTMSTGRVVALWQEAGVLHYSTSADRVTWTADSAVASAPNTAGGVWDDFVQNGNTIYGLYAVNGTTSTLNIVPIVFDTTANTLTAGTVNTILSTNSNVMFSAMGVWDATNSVIHIVYSYLTYVYLSAWAPTSSSSAYGLKTLLSTGSGSPYPVGLAKSGAALYPVYTDGTNLFLAPVTIGTPAAGYTVGGQETVVAGTSVGRIAIDSNGGVNVLYGVSTTLYAVMRTGTNAYSTPVSVASSNVGNAFSINPDANGNLYVYYESTANQPNGEIYQVIRSGGAWNAASVAVNGASSGLAATSGFSGVVSGDTANSNVDLLWQSGTTTVFDIYYDKIAVGSTPNTPTITSPASASYSTTTPTFTHTYSNPSPGDGQSAYEYKVIRTSDSVVMWDSGKVASSATSGIAYGGTSTTSDPNYIAPVALATSTQYGVQVRVWDTVLGNVSAWSTQIAFTPKASPTAAITSLNGSAGSKSSTVGTATAAGATSLPLAAGGGASFAVNDVIAVGASGAIDIVTISAIATDTLTVGAMTHAHAVGDAVTAAGSVTVTTTALSTIAAWNQADGDTTNAYTQTLYQSDGVTLVDSTSGAVSPAVANGSNATLPTWTPSGMSNGLSYKLVVTLTDTTTGLVAQTAAFSLTTNYAPPATASNVAATPNTTNGRIELSWSVGSDAASVTVERRISGSSDAWTTLSTGTLRTSLHDYCPLSTAYDYGITTISSLGVASARIVVSGVTLGLKYGGYGHWFTASNDPDGMQAALGVVDQWNTTTQWAHQEDVLRVVPLGRPRPITSYGKTDWWQAQSRVYWVPSSDSDGLTTTLGSDIFATISAAATTHTILLHRDPTGIARWVQIDKLTPSFESTDILLQLDLSEVDYHGGSTVLVS